MLEVELKVETGIQGDEIGPEIVLHWYAPELKTGGVSVLDTSVYGRAGGGTRMLPDITSQEIVALARAMTYKSGAMGRPRGGGKSGIWADPGASGPRRESIMRAMGRAIRPLVQTMTFHAGADMGTSHLDCVWIREESGQPAPKVELTLQERDGELLEFHYTGFGVVVAAKAACEFKGIDIAKTSVAIEGFGKVGGGVARYMNKSGARIIAISTLKGTLYNEKGLNVMRLLELRKQFGDDLVLRYGDGRILAKEDLFTLPVHILVPGARPWAINRKNVDKVQAKIISSGANIPITEEAEERLYQRGVVVVPDFISNCGGTGSSDAGRLGLNADQAFDAVDKLVGALTKEILESSAQEKVNPSRLSKLRTLEKIRKARKGNIPTQADYEKGYKALIGLS